MNKPIDTDYFLLLDLECQFIEAGNDLIAARAMAKNELLRLRNSDVQYDFDRARAERDWCGND